MEKLIYYLGKKKTEKRKFKLKGNRKDNLVELFSDVLVTLVT